MIIRGVCWNCSTQPERAPCKTHPGTLQPSSVGEPMVCRQCLARSVSTVKTATLAEFLIRRAVNVHSQTITLRCAHERCPARISLPACEASTQFSCSCVSLRTDTGAPPAQDAEAAARSGNLSGTLRTCGVAHGFTYGPRSLWGVDLRIWAGGVAGYSRSTNSGPFRL